MADFGATWWQGSYDLPRPSTKVSAKSAQSGNYGHISISVFVVSGHLGVCDLLVVVLGGDVDLEVGSVDLHLRRPLDFRLTDHRIDLVRNRLEPVSEREKINRCIFIV